MFDVDAKREQLLNERTKAMRILNEAQQQVQDTVLLVERINGALTILSEIKDALKEESAYAEHTN